MNHRNHRKSWDHQWVKLDFNPHVRLVHPYGPMVTYLFIELQTAVLSIHEQLGQGIHTVASYNPVSMYLHLKWGEHGNRAAMLLIYLLYDHSCTKV